MLIKAERAKEVGWVALEAFHVSIAPAADELTVIWKRSHVKYSRTVSEKQYEHVNSSNFFLLERILPSSVFCCTSE